MAVNPENFGEVTPRKGPSAILVIVVVIVVVAIIGGVTLFTGGKGSEGNTNPNPVLPTTITQLKSKVDSLNSTVIGFSGRLSKVEQTVAGISAPTVTKAEFDGLQTAVNDLADSVANWSEANISGGLDYWLEEDDGDIRIHILSAKDMRFVAEVTVSYDDSTIFGNTTYDRALQYFYNDVGDDRDYLPNFVPYNTIPYTTETCSNYTLTIKQNGTDTPFDIHSCYNTTVVLSDWEYSAIMFHTGSFKVTAGEESSKRIKYLPEGYDTISIKLLPSLEVGESGGDDDGV